MTFSLISTLLSTSLACDGAHVTTAGYGAQKDILTTAQQAGSFNTLVAAVSAAQLTEALSTPGPFTVFAPTDEAFSKLPPDTLQSLLKLENRAKLAAILSYHVVPGRVTASDVVKLTEAQTLNGQMVEIVAGGGSVTVDGANVVKPDIMCSNGVIHVIDAVILPSMSNIVQTASSAGSFNTLAKALQAGGLVGTLEGDGPFTVFAPTDEAFAKLPPGTLEMLLKPENRKQLQDILKYHVVPGRVYAKDALAAGQAVTVQGSQVRFTANQGKAMINNADIVATNIDASNGVIHVIDRVILPG